MYGCTGIATVLHTGKQRVNLRKKVKLKTVELKECLA